MAARGQSPWVIAAFLVAGSVAGACLMYALGVWAFEPLIEPAFARLGLLPQYEEAGVRLRENGFAALALVAATPFPLQIGAAAAGAAGYPFTAFLLVITVARAVRYAVLAGAVALVGARAGDLIERHETTILLAGAAVFLVIAAWMVFGGR